jgi:hypothetical protein
VRPALRRRRTPIPIRQVGGYSFGRAIGKVEFQDKNVQIEVDERQLSCSDEDELGEMDIVPFDDF